MLHFHAIPSIGRRNVRVPFICLILILSLALLAVGCGSKDKNSSARNEPLRAAAAGQPVQAIKIAVDQAGIYRITGKQLRSAGFDLDAGDAAMLSLSLAGQPVPFLLESQGRDIELIFHGRPRESRYGRENVYWLRRLAEGEAAVEKNRSPRLVIPAEEEEATAFEQLLTLQEDNHYLSQLPEGSDHWLWQPIFAPDVYTVSLTLPHWAQGDVALSVTLWANTEDYKANPDHRIILAVNGQPLADHSWDGKGWRILDLLVPASLLTGQADSLTIQAPGDTEAVVDVVYLDRVDITYPRRYVAENGQLQFSAPAGAALAISGFQDDDLLLWDLDGASRGGPLAGFAASGGVLRFQDAQPGKEKGSYAAASRSALLAPKAIEPGLSRDLRDNPQGADYIAIVAPGFARPLEPLLELRRSQGLRVTVAEIDEVYDTFSAGMLDPAAIRDYMLYARTHWPPPAPRFLLLVGDASYDYLGNLPNSTPNLVPTYLLQTHFVGETASDNWFVSLTAGYDQPEMAVGRIPAQTAEQVAVAVAKTLAYETAAPGGDWLGRALFVADNKQDSFQVISDELAGQFLPAAYQVDKIYLGQTPDPAGEVLATLRQGVGLVTYVGHGSMNVWAQEKMFQIDDVASLDNASALPFMMTLTCLVGYFHHPQAASMGEELLFKKDGGVVAALVPTSESLANDQRDLARNLYKHLFGSAPTIGEAIMLAKQDLPGDYGIMQDLIETFTLLGDPALVLQRPG